ncbi:MAG: phosphatase PAP2 family protein [Treponema sp.]|nr:phosphatase PAP2 family protein [Treponema sp.]
MDVGARGQFSERNIPAPTAQERKNRACENGWPESEWALRKKILFDSGGEGGNTVYFSLQYENTMKKLPLLFCLLLTVALQGHAESAFTYDMTKDIAIGALSLGVFVSPFFVSETPKQAPTALDKNSVNAFDRGLMFPYSKPLDLISDFGVYGLLALPALSLAGNFTDKGALLTYSIMYTEAVLLTFGTKELLKNAIIRFRPYIYAGGVPAGLENDYYNSFPSGSTSLAFLSAGFLSATFLAEHPDSPLKAPVVAGAYALAVGVAACRILSGSHFLTDVLAGAAIGSLYGWAIPLSHKKQRAASDVSIAIAGNGVVVSIRF